MFAEFRNVLELLSYFPNEQSCIDALEEIRWGEIVVSPFDEKSIVYKCKNNKYRCKSTGKYFNVRTGTMFDNTKVSLRKWFLAIYYATNHKKGISSLQLSKDIGVTQKTAWFMLQRIRNCFDIDIEDTILEEVIEVDETFVGGKNKNRHWDKKVPKSQGRSFKDKTPVFGMMEREGKVVARVVPDTSASSLLPLLYKHTKLGSTVYSDEWKAYSKIGDDFDHWFVSHGIGQYAIDDIYTNNIECFWSHLKRRILGVHHSVSRKHLQLYVNAEEFRHNTLKISMSQRFWLLLRNAGHRITYEALTSG